MSADRPTTTSGKIKVNLSLDTDAVELLDAISPTRRAYGAIISQLIRAEHERQQASDLAGRVRKLEAELAELRQQVAQQR